MSTEIAVKPPSEPLVPVMPASLQTAITACTDRVHGGSGGDIGHYVPGRPPTFREISDAAAMVPIFAAALRPVVPEHLKRWLRELVDALPIGGVTGDPDRLRNATSAVVQAVGDLPGFCFLAETSKLVIRSCEFFPTGRRLYEMLAPLEAKVRREAEALSRIAGYRPPDVPADAGPDQSEKALVGHALSMLAQEMRERAEANEPAREAVRPAFLTGDALRLVREQAGMILAREGRQ